jgi:hypothetical protein
MQTPQKIEEAQLQEGQNLYERDFYAGTQQ